MLLTADGLGTNELMRRTGTSNTATRAALERETGRLITKAKSHPQVENLTGHMVKFPVRLERDLDPYGAIVRLDRVPRVRLTDPHPPGGEARPALAERSISLIGWVIVISARLR